MDELAELRRRIANIIRRGVISEVKMGSPIKVRVKLGEDEQSPWLPWCQTQSSAYVQYSDPPAVNDAVTIFSEAGDIQNGRVYPGANIDAIQVPAGSENEHVILFDDTTEVRYDRSEHHLKILLIEGGKYLIRGEGTLDGNVLITKELTVKGNIYGKSEVFDISGSMNQIRTIYNGHTHMNTPPPAPQMVVVAAEG